MKIINEIPEEYNDHLPRLLEDFQQGKISMEEVVQILVLWSDKGTFRALHDTDTRYDLYFVHKDHHNMVLEDKRRMYEQETAK